MNEITRLPVQLNRLSERDRQGFGKVGWTFMHFASSEDAAVFFQSQPHHFPCWQRLEVVNGKLVQVR